MFVYSFISFRPSGNLYTVSHQATISVPFHFFRIVIIWGCKYEFCSTINKIHCKTKVKNSTQLYVSLPGHKNYVIGNIYVSADEYWA